MGTTTATAVLPAPVSPLLPPPPEFPSLRDGSEVVAEVGLVVVPVVGVVGAAVDETVRVVLEGSLVLLLSDGVGVVEVGCSGVVVEGVSGSEVLVGVSAVVVGTSGVVLVGVSAVVVGSS